MAASWATKFYKSRQWQECRAACFIAQDGVCEVCGNPGKIVHHIQELTPDNIDNPMVTLNMDNLQLLCWSCHERTKSKVGIPIRPDISFDHQGNVVPTGKAIPPYS